MLPQTAPVSDLRSAFTTRAKTMRMAQTKLAKLARLTGFGGVRMKARGSDGLRRF